MNIQHSPGITVDCSPAITRVGKRAVLTGTVNTDVVWRGIQATWIIGTESTVICLPEVSGTCKSNGRQIMFTTDRLTEGVRKEFNVELLLGSGDRVSCTSELIIIGTLDNTVIH